MPVFTTGETIALNTDRSAVAIPTIAVSADLSIPVYTLKVSAEVSDGAESYWSADLINWTKFSNHVEFSANGVYYFKAVDAENFLESKYTTLTVSNIDRIAPAKPSASADITNLTNKNVTVTAVFSSDSTRREFRIGDGNWQTYTSGVIMKQNGVIQFRAADVAGNISDITSFSVSNIDNTAPAIPGNVSIQVNRYNAKLNWQDISDTGIAGTKGYYLRYGSSSNLTGEGTFVLQSEFSLNDLLPGTRYFQVRSVDMAGNISEWSKTMHFEIPKPAPLNLSGTAAKLSWSENYGASKYIVEYSKNSFSATLSVETSSAALDVFALPTGTYSWRVKESGSDYYGTGNLITSTAKNVPQTLVSTRNGNTDLFFAAKHGIWQNGYLAQNMGNLNGNGAAGELAVISGKNKFTDVFVGSADTGILVLTDDANGDALFADNVFDTLGNTSRITLINEIRAGFGDDIIDMTSTRWTNSENITFRGGSGDDIIWASGKSGQSVIFGDAGNDRLTGGSGNDFIIGGSGNDSMHGGGGSDTFCFGNNWGQDVIEQRSGNKVILHFAEGSMNNWNAKSCVYQEGSNSVTVKGTTNIELYFGSDISGLPSGALADFTSEKIFETSILA